MCFENRVGGLEPSLSVQLTPFALEEIRGSENERYAARLVIRCAMSFCFRRHLCSR